MKLTDDYNPETKQITVNEEQAQAILKRRTAIHTNENMDPNTYREQYSRKYAFFCPTD